LSDANLLLLDEPTNHLDIPSQEILQEVLQDYQGTILLVSHDRYLIDALGTQIWEIEPGEAAMRVFEGSYTQHRAQREAEQNSAAETRQQDAASRGRSRPDRQSREQRKRKARLSEVEAQIAELEARLAGLSRQLENPPADPEQVQRLGREYVAVQGEMEALFKEWERLQE
jgi:ATP-binding cassette subfamily F protein 3